MAIKAVIFDLGGVVVASPFAAIFAYERSENIPKGGILNVIKKYGDASAFALLERSAISFEAFCTKFKEQCTESGLPTADGGKFIEHIEGCWQNLNPEIVTAISQLRKNGIKTAALTNNWYGPSNDKANKPAGTSTPAERVDLYGLIQHFDVVVESRVVKMRKPDPKIYALTCERLGLSPNQCVYLDDIGGNLKPAQQMGIKTIHVKPHKAGPRNAVNELQQYFDFSLSTVSKL